mgnify:CR=1 FL=1
MEENKTTIVQKTDKSGITFGSALAMVISYTTWNSVWGTIFHGLIMGIVVLELVVLVFFK